MISIPKTRGDVNFHTPFNFHYIESWWSYDCLYTTHDNDWLYCLSQYALNKNNIISWICNFPLYSTHQMLCMGLCVRACVSPYGTGIIYFKENDEKNETINKSVIYSLNGRWISQKQSIWRWFERILAFWWIPKSSISSLLYPIPYLKRHSQFWGYFMSHSTIHLRN